MLSKFQIRRNYSTIHPDGQNENSIIYCLPTDILHVIMEFYTNLHSDLFRLRRISKEWKELSESSILWSKMNLTLYCPKEYLLLYFHFQHHTHASLEAFYVDVFINPDEGLDLDAYDIKLSPFSEIVTTPNQQRNGFLRVLVDSSNLHDAMNSKELKDRENAFQQSKRIFLWFKEISRSSQEKWMKGIQFQKSILFLEWIVGEDMFSSFTVKSMYVTLPLFLCAYKGFYTLQHHFAHRDHFIGMTLENHISFICMELICFIYFISGILDAIRRMVTGVIIAVRHHSRISPELKIWKCLLYRCLLFEPIYLCGLMMFLFIHFKLTFASFPPRDSSSSSRACPWSLLLIPMGVYFFSIIALSDLAYKQDRTNNDTESYATEMKDFRKFILVIFIVLICLSLLCLLGDGFIHVHHHEEYKYGLGIALLLPFVPVYFIVLLFFFIFEMPSFFYRSPTFISRHILLLTRIIMIGRILCALLSAGTLLLLCIYAFQPNLMPVSKGLPPVFTLYLFLFAIHGHIDPTNRTQMNCILDEHTK